MNAFETLLNLPAQEKKNLGVEFTPQEIAQQPSTWAKAAQLLIARKAEITQFLRTAGVTGRRNATGHPVSRFDTNERIEIEETRQWPKHWA